MDAPTKKPTICRCFRSKKIQIPLIITFVLVAFVLIFFKYIVTFLFAIDFILLESDVTTPLQLLTPNPHKETITLSTPMEDVKADFYYYPDRHRDHAYVLCVPLSLKGKDELALKNGAQSFARIGYDTLLLDGDIDPQTGENTGRMDLNDIEILKAGLRFLTGKGYTHIRIMGGSYGFFPTLMVTIDPEFKKNIDLIFAFGPYYDFTNVLFNFLTLKQGTALNDSSAPIDIYANKIINRSFRKNLKLDNTIFDHVKTREEFDEVLATIPQHAKNTLEKFSPKNYLDKLNTPIVIAHSKQDYVIPYSESFLLRDNLPSHVKYKFVLVDTAKHLKPGPLTFKKFREETLPGFLTFYDLIYAILN